MASNYLESLTRTQLQRLNKVFNDYSSQNAAPEPDEPAQGGFMQDEPMEGGFMPDETIAMAEAQPTASHKGTDRIRLSVIPSALDELDLPCDLDIIATFEQAAESDDDEDEEMGVRGDGPAKESITRERFLQVCAALMGDSEDEAEEQPEEPRRRRQRPGKEKADEYDEEDSDSEEVAEPGSKRLTRAARKSMKGKQADLQEGDEELSNVEEDEETVTAATTASVTKAKKASKKKSLASERVLNPEQLQVVSDMFANFFENKPAQGTDSGSLGLAEVRYVATLLGENLTDGDILEMLEFASTGATNRVALSDFEGIMKQIKAV